MRYQPDIFGSNQSRLDTETLAEFDKHVNVNTRLISLGNMQWVSAVKLHQQPL